MYLKFWINLNSVPKSTRVESWMSRITLIFCFSIVIRVYDFKIPHWTHSYHWKYWEIVENMTYLPILSINYMMSIWLYINKRIFSPTKLKSNNIKIKMCVNYFNNFG